MLRASLSVLAPRAPSVVQNVLRAGLVTKLPPTLTESVPATPASNAFESPLQRRTSSPVEDGTSGSSLAGSSSNSLDSNVSPKTTWKASRNARSESLGRSYLYGAWQVRSVRDANVEVLCISTNTMSVPASAERMLEKSLTTNSDVIIYDLEDSIPPSPVDKNAARGRLAHFLSTRANSLPSSERIAVRLNSNATPFFAEDLLQAMRLPCIRTLVLPKVHSVQDLDHVSEEIFVTYKANKFRDPYGPPVQIVASVESAKAMYNLGAIAGWQSRYGPALGGQLSALLFAAEDYCADTGIIRTSSRQELLYTRSHIVVTAKAFGLKAIDMVCVNYKDLEYLRHECEDGRRLGFTGKQAIHPSQVDVIQSTFVPSAKEILRAARILKQMEKAHQLHKGAAGLELEGGGLEMIDAPMIKQAENIVRIAKSAGLPIPEVD
ncbi:Pyruvate/Phosphoenolpyruvate kinase-like domain-containing protein [Trametes elegans]|nr:Pyruvate/Phosphoenolpyruvate kinase-like domain-containing protein [Trametes elegans]